MHIPTKPWNITLCFRLILITPADTAEPLPRSTLNFCDAKTWDWEVVPAFPSFLHAFHK